MITGMFQGMIAPQTPSGTLVTRQSPALPRCYGLPGRLSGNGCIVFKNICASSHLVDGFLKWFTLFLRKEPCEILMIPSYQLLRHGRG